MREGVVIRNNTKDEQTADAVRLSPSYPVLNMVKEFLVSYTVIIPARYQCKSAMTRHFGS